MASAGSTARVGFQAAANSVTRWMGAMGARSAAEGGVGGQCAIAYPPRANASTSSAASTSGRPPTSGALPSGVGAMVAVASGKGGVGKSTTAVNLAVATAQAGLRVGILDADIYGPSVPKMLGLSDLGYPEVEDAEGGGARRMIPRFAHGIECNSMGFLVEPGEAAIWRGPMVMKALGQLLDGTAWGTAWGGGDGGLDVLYVDLPPGTGDVQLTLAQRYGLHGAVIVSTPQDVALIDVRRAATMFRKTKVDMLGVIENMSGFVCPNCKHESPIFGSRGGAKAFAEEAGMPLLAQIPIDPAICEAADGGVPAVVAAGLAGESEDSVVVAQYRQAVRSVLAMLDER